MVVNSEIDIRVILFICHWVSGEMVLCNMTTILSEKVTERRGKWMIANYFRDNIQIQNSIHQKCNRSNSLIGNRSMGASDTKQETIILEILNAQYSNSKFYSS